MEDGVTKTMLWELLLLHPDLKNVIDNAIANADFESLIIVCPTYNNTSSSDSGSFFISFTINTKLS